MRPKFRRPAPQPGDISPGARSLRPLSDLGTFTDASTSGMDQGISFRDRDDSERIEGVYIISVAARILEMHPQTLRKYERVGLVTPSRTVGMLRLYSEVDIARLRLIKHLVGDLGLNLAGVQLILEVFNHMLRVRNHLDTVQVSELRHFLMESLNELLELLHAHGP